jgi:hypothetical protein
MNCTAVVSTPPAAALPLTTSARVLGIRDIAFSVLKMLTLREQCRVARVSPTFNAAQKMCKTKHVELTSKDSVTGDPDPTVTSLKLHGKFVWTYDTLKAVFVHFPNVRQLDLKNALLRWEGKSLGEIRRSKNPIHALDEFILDLQEKGECLTELSLPWGTRIDQRIPEREETSLSNQADLQLWELVMKMDFRGLVHLDVEKLPPSEKHALQFYEKLTTAVRLQTFVDFLPPLSEGDYLRHLPLGVTNLRYSCKKPQSVPLFLDCLKRNPIADLTIDFRFATPQPILDGLVSALQKVKHFKLETRSISDAESESMTLSLVQNKTLETLFIRGKLSSGAIRKMLDSLRAIPSLRNLHLRCIEVPTDREIMGLLPLTLQYPTSVNVGLGDADLFTSRFYLTNRQKQLEWLMDTILPVVRSFLCLMNRYEEVCQHRKERGEPAPELFPHEKEASLKLQALNLVPQETIIRCWYRERGHSHTTQPGLSSLALVSAIEGIPVSGMEGPA